MNALILAAGYATRLYPLTLAKAKPLLEVAGKPMIEWVLDGLAPIPDLDAIHVVTNNKFANDFRAWADAYSRRSSRFAFKIINDGSTGDDDKKGAIGDIHFAIHREHLYANDLIVVAGDNLFSESVEGFAAAGKDAPATVAVYDVGDLELAKKYNSISVDPRGRITKFVEKSPEPESTLSAIALYYYRRDTLPFIDQYIAEGNNPDQPGRLIEWLHHRTEVRTWRVPGIWFDIGGPESLAEADQIFAQFAK
ncbi:MAG: nucleotidyltransferase family protein [Terrimicrobiaceae bacterium]|nr:nucleotidyltransferase family protein [Terrimicrobiaceae bacterium]